MIEFSAKTWFGKGLQFTCTECGQCCTGEPGVVIVYNEDIEKIARLLDLSVAEVRRKYVRKVLEGQSLKERRNGDCIFFKDNKCSIYKARPSQCRTYPFWFRNMRSKEAWTQTAKECPGIGQGRLYTKEQIMKRVHQSMELD